MTSNYPVEKTLYLQSVGRLLPRGIGWILKQVGCRPIEGYTIEVNCNQSNGVDLKVQFNGNAILVVEVLNWCIRSRMSEKRKNSIIENLTQYGCMRILIYTAFANEEVLEELPRFGILLLKIGYQILPRYFYEFFAYYDQVELRKIDSKETTEDIKSRITALLQLRLQGAQEARNEREMTIQ